MSIVVNIYKARYVVGCSSAPAVAQQAFSQRADQAQWRAFSRHSAPSTIQATCTYYEMQGGLAKKANPKTFLFVQQQHLTHSPAAKVADAPSGDLKTCSWEGNHGQEQAGAVH